MKIDVYIMKVGREVFTEAKPVGHIDLPTFDRGRCWDLCNWMWWADEKPKENHTEIRTIDHGIIFYDPSEDEYHMALSNGWMSGTLEDCEAYAGEHSDTYYWPVG